MDIIFEILFETKYKSIAWSSAHHFLYVAWKSFTTSDKYREAAMKQVQYVSEKKASKILYDLTQFKGISPEDQKWALEVHIPALIEAGLRKTAIVYPRDIFGKVAMDTVIKQSKGTTVLISRNFFDQEEAIRWLGQD